MRARYLSAAEQNDTYVLVEGGAWGDAEFYGNWLLMAAKANDENEVKQIGGDGIENERLKFLVSKLRHEHHCHNSKIQALQNF